MTLAHRGNGTRKLEERQKSGILEWVRDAGLDAVFLLGGKMENDSLVAAGVGMIINSVSEEHQAIVRDLLTGPEEVACAIARAFEDRHMTEMPEWAGPAIRSMRPLSRRFIARVFERNGVPLNDNPTTRALGFFGDWTPV